MDATAASRREERAGATTQLWKTNDALANKDGPRSTVFWVNKNTYTGEWRGNQKEGRGEYTYTDKGLKYEGDFLRGKRHGHGVLWQKEKGGRMRRVYEGEWCQGKRQVPPSDPSPRTAPRLSRRSLAAGGAGASRRAGSAVAPRRVRTRPPGRQEAPGARDTRIPRLD